MWPNRASNPGPLTYESGALPTALRSPANNNKHVTVIITIAVYITIINNHSSVHVTVIIITAVYRLLSLLPRQYTYYYHLYHSSIHMTIIIITAVYRLLSLLPQQYTGSCHYYHGSIHVAVIDTTAVYMLL